MSASRCGSHDRRPTRFAALWRSTRRPIGRDRGTGGYRVTPGPTRTPPAGVVRRGGRWTAASTVDDRPQRQPVGLVGRPGRRRRRGRPAATSTRCRDGGAFDGPLGVVSALLAVDLLRERGVTPARPIGVVAFADEEGARFGVACLGSRLLTGALDRGAGARACATRTASRLAEALRRGRATRRLGAEPDRLRRVGAFVELHVEQGRALVDLGRPVGVATAIWPHGRWRIDFAGEANHAGTTRMADRHDPMLTFAYAVLAANKRGRGWHGARHRRPGRRRAERHQRHRRRGDRLAGRPGRRTVHAGRTWSRRSGAGPRSGPGGTARRSTMTAESVSPVDRLRPGPRAAGSWRLRGGAPAAAHRRRARRRRPGRRRGADGDAVRAQPDRGLALPGRARRPMPTARAGVEALADRAARTWPVDDALLAPSRPGSAAAAGARRTGVLVEVDRRPVHRRCRPGCAAPPADATRLPGLTRCPGLANAHSPRLPPGAARADPGRQRAPSGPGGSGCTPSPGGSTRTLPRAGAGDLRRDGPGRDHLRRRVPLPAPRPRRRPYADPNAMGHALIAAAAEAGIRITLLDTCYLTATVDRRAAARACSGGSATATCRAWAERVDRAERRGRRVRAGRGGPLGAGGAGRASRPNWRAAAADAPLHVHLSEQPAENEACLAVHGRTPTGAARRRRVCSGPAPPRCTPPT